MRFIKKQLSLWLIVLIIAVAAMAIPIASRVSPTAMAIVKEQQDYPDQQAAVANDSSKDAKVSNNRKAAVGKGIARRQDDYYDRRRDYWERRVERRLDEEYMDEQAVDDNNADAKNSKTKKDSKATKDKAAKDATDDEFAADDEFAGDDEVDQEIERRREYWRKRVEREW
jgi:hypothetical protein